MLDHSTVLADPLSDILSLLKPRSVACGAVDAGAACISFPVGHGIKCHAVIAGEAWLAVDGVADVLHLKAGDCCILPHRHAYRFATDLSLPSTEYRTVLSGLVPGHITTWNGGGRATIVSASFTIEQQYAAMLLDILPPIAHVQDNADRLGLRRSLHQMMQELGDQQPGSRLIVEHLSTMILAQALRTYGAVTGEGRVGWLFALADRQIGTTIRAMHENPAYRWTVQALAKRAGMSRTSFAIRFKASVGSAPMTYLTRLRMLLAGDRLSTSGDAICLVAQSLGYDSESAFSHAFKRHLGCSPRRFVKSGAMNKPS